MATGPPRKVALFSGHMIDAPGRRIARFPADKETVAAQAIARELAVIGLGAGDLAICGGACGGDLLFAEAALTRGAALELYLPAEEPEFLQTSVAFAGGQWLKRFKAAKSRATMHSLPRERPTPGGASPYELNNLRMLEAAERYGADRVEFICLWNGEAGDGPGGTRQLMELVRARGGRAHWLDTRKLWA